MHGWVGEISCFKLHFYRSETSTLTSLRLMRPNQAVVRKLQKEEMFSGEKWESWFSSPHYVKHPDTSVKEDHTKTFIQSEQLLTVTQQIFFILLHELKINVKIGKCEKAYEIFYKLNIVFFFRDLKFPLVISRYVH